MCLARRTQARETTKKIAAIATKTPENTISIKADRRLNPSATEFVSSRSESETSSVGDDAESEHLEHLEAIQNNRQSKGAEAHQPMDQYPNTDTDEEHRFNSYHNHGWESPQGVLPPVAGGASPPPGSHQAVAYTALPAGMMPPPPHYSSNHHHYGPSHYPVYHVYSTHHPDAIDRASSPPPAGAIYAPAGGSPPLAPGFISVSLQAQHSGHLRGSSPIPGGSPRSSSMGLHLAGAPLMPVHHHHHHHAISMGSSPPTNGFTHDSGNSGGHYHVYAAPHQAYPPHHGNEDYPQHHPLPLPAAHSNNHYHHGQYDNNNGMMAELQPRMSSMSLGGASPPEGGSPTRGNTRASARIARSHRAGGAYNPSDFEFKITPSADDGNTEAAAADVKTTVMIRNIPNKYTQEIMLSLLEEAGLNGSFDFFYLPIDFRNRCGLGYSFLNFLTHADAEKAYQYFHKRRWDEFNSKKVCEVTYARVQGRDNLVQHFKNAKFPSTDAEYCPLVYRHHTENESEEVRAHMPLPIHAYLESLEEEAQVHADGSNQETQEEEVVKDAEE